MRTASRSSLLTIRLRPRHREATSEAYAAAADPIRRALYDVEYRTVGKEDGVLRWVAAKGRGIFEQERCVRVIGTAIDITARKKAEERLRQLNETLERRVAEEVAEKRLLADTVAGMDASLQVLDRDLRFMAINRTAQDDYHRVFGVRPAVGERLTVNPRYASTMAADVV
jgi:hypothetical protein